MARRSVWEQSDFLKDDGPAAADGFPRYVPVAERKKVAAKATAQLTRRGRPLAPVQAASRRMIAAGFWGRAWCANLEARWDLPSRLDRGRSYVRSGSVIDLDVERGHVSALVAGGEVYTVEVSIESMDPAAWDALVRAAAGTVGSTAELLADEPPNALAAAVTREGAGLFPGPEDLTAECSCPDTAPVCKHVAAAMYGVGARLDRDPSALFKLRGVDAGALVGEGTPARNEPIGTVKLVKGYKLEAQGGGAGGGGRAAGSRGAGGDPHPARATRATRPRNGGG